METTITSQGQGLGLEPPEIRAARERRAEQLHFADRSLKLKDTALPGCLT